MIYKLSPTGHWNPEIQYTDNPREQKMLEKPIGRWGKMWQEWMKTEYPTEVSVLIMEGRWSIIPREIDAEGSKRFQELDEQYRQQNPRPQTFSEIQQWEKTRILTIEHQLMSEVVFNPRTQ